MIIGDSFAWAHLAKTGGDATYRMFIAVPGLVSFADPLESNDKHTPFFAREDEVRDKLLVMNIRRLPAWTLSAGHHAAAVGLHPEYRPLPLETPEQMSSKTDADDLLRWMTDGNRFAVDRWLRLESLEQDVLALLDELGELRPGVEDAVRAVGQVNARSYDRAVDRRFSSEQIERMYELNPGWAEIERRVYGEDR
jgi:hypothetical protein